MPRYKRTQLTLRRAAPASYPANELSTHELIGMTTVVEICLNHSVPTHPLQTCCSFNVYACLHAGATVTLHRDPPQGYDLHRRITAPPWHWRRWGGQWRPCTAPSGRSSCSRAPPRAPSVRSQAWLSDCDASASALPVFHPAVDRLLLRQDAAYRRPQPVQHMRLKTSCGRRHPVLQARGRAAGPKTSLIPCSLLVCVTKKALLIVEPDCCLGVRAPPSRIPLCLQSHSPLPLPVL